MARRAKTKPKNPQLIASEKARKALEQRLRDFGAVNLQPEAATLPANAEVEVRRESQEHVESARRADVFDLLRSGLAVGAYDAVRRLERDIVMRRGEHDHGRPLERVSGDEHSAFCRNDFILAAGERVDQIVRLLAPRDWWLLHDLITSRKPWRDTVAYITGETHDHAQAAAVRSACVNLRDLAQRKIRRAA